MISWFVNVIYFQICLKSLATVFGYDLTCGFRLYMEVCHGLSENKVGPKIKGSDKKLHLYAVSLY